MKRDPTRWSGPVAEAMERQGLSTYRLAEALEVDRSMVSAILNARRRVGRRMALALQCVLAEYGEQVDADDIQAWSARAVERRAQRQGS